MPERKETNNLIDRLIQSVILADYGWKNGLLRLLGKILFKKPDHGKIRKILLYRRGGIGDSITALQALERIRNAYPDATIDLLTHRPQSWQPGLDRIAPENSFSQVITYDGFRVGQIARKIRKEKYDLFITLPNYYVSLAFELRSICIARLAGIPSGIGWQIGSTRFLARHQHSLFRFDYDADRMLKLLDKLGIPNQLERGKTSPQNSASGKCNSIALVISAGRPQNNWPHENYGLLAQNLINVGHEVFLLGGNREKEQAVSIKEICPQAQNLCGKLEFEEYQEFFSHCRLIIGNDTGIMHIAYTTSTPVITLFSARDYAGKWFPQDRPNSIALRYDAIPCAQCFTETCADNKCIQYFTPSMVLAHARQLLGNTVPEENRV